MGAGPGADLDFDGLMERLADVGLAEDDHGWLSC